jgi:RNA polymerase sigma factor (sigma-70 family)
MDSTWTERLSNAVTATPDALPLATASPTDFDQLYRTCAPLLRKIAIGKFHVPRADAEALVHDVFATYLVSAADVRKPEPYLIGAICNAARQYWRKETVRQAMFCDEEPCAATPDDALVDDVVRTLVIRATLSRLGRSCRDTLRQFYLEAETTAAIAIERNTTAAYIRRLLTYCRARAQAIYRQLERKP